jgi:hypothetical protein
MMRPGRPFGIDAMRLADMRVAVIAAAALAGIAAAGAKAEDSEIAGRRAAEQTTFTDAEITAGFFKTAFGAELQVSGRSDRIRKYAAPVRVFPDSRAEPDRRREVIEVVADIGARVQHLDIAMARREADANVLVTLVRDHDLAGTITSFYGSDQARRIERSLAPQCLSGFHKDDAFRITHSDAIVVVDAGDFVFRDCIYEELLQALGPINDTDQVPWTMFNDGVQKGFFDVYDQYILNILYDPRIRPGMTAPDVAALLPQVLPDVRAFVAKVNHLGN